MTSHCHTASKALLAMYFTGIGCPRSHALWRHHCYQSGGCCSCFSMPSATTASMQASASQQPKPWWLQTWTLSKLKSWDRRLYSVVCYESGWQVWRLCRMWCFMVFPFASTSLAVTSRILVWPPPLWQLFNCWIPSVNYHSHTFHPRKPIEEEAQQWNMTEEDRQFHLRRLKEMHGCIID